LLIAQPEEISLLTLQILIIDKKEEGTKDAIKNSSRQMIWDQLNGGATSGHFDTDGVQYMEVIGLHPSSSFRYQVFESMKLVNSIRAENVCKVNGVFLSYFHKFYNFRR
jgi:hypothetical protein